MTATTLLSLVRQVQQRLQETTGKPASLVAIPRDLAIVLAGEWAQEVRQDINPAQMGVLMDPAHEELVLALDDLPVIAMPLPGAFVAGWTTPFKRYKEDLGWGEHETIPTLPWSAWLAEQHANPQEAKARITALCAQVKREAQEISARPAPYFTPLTAELVSSGRMSAKTPTKEVDREELHEDPAIAWQQVLDGMEEHADAIQTALDTQARYDMMIVQPSADFLKRFADAVLERFAAVVASEPTDVPGVVRLVFTPSKIVA